MAIVYRCISQKVLGFIATEGGRSNDPGVPYLSIYLENYSNVSICPVLCPCAIVSYFSYSDAIDNRNRIRQYDIALEKYWVTQSGYFRLATKL